MQHDPVTTRTSPALADTAQAAGRIAVLLLFTGLFAAAWNGDRSSPVAMHLVSRPHDRRDADTAAILSGARTSAVGVSPQHQPVWMTPGGDVVGSALAAVHRSPFSGSPALLGGTLRTGDNVPVIVIAEPDADEPAR